MSAAEFEMIKAEAVEIARNANSLRVRGADGKRPATITVFRAIDLSCKVPPRGVPDPEGPQSQVYEAGLRFWAVRVARLINYPEWQLMMEHAAGSVPEFKGDLTRFFEARFAGLRLRDGSLIVL